MTLPRPASSRIGLAPAEPRGRAEPPNDAGFFIRLQQLAISVQISEIRCLVRCGIHISIRSASSFLDGRSHIC